MDEPYTKHTTHTFEAAGGEPLSTSYNVRRILPEHGPSTRNSWQVFQGQVYKRDGYQCQDCHDQPRKSELTLDHIIPRSRGGCDCPGNLQTLCKGCNTSKADRLDVALGGHKWNECPIRAAFYGGAAGEGSPE